MVINKILAGIHSIKHQEICESLPGFKWRLWGSTGHLKRSETHHFPQGVQSPSAGPLRGSDQSFCRDSEGQDPAEPKQFALGKKTLAILNLACTLE